MICIFYFLDLIKRRSLKSNSAPLVFKLRCPILSRVLSYYLFDASFIGKPLYSASSHFDEWCLFFRVQWLSLHDQNV